MQEDTCIFLTNRGFSYKIKGSRANQQEKHNSATVDKGYEQKNLSTIKSPPKG